MTTLYRWAMVPGPGAQGCGGVLGVSGSLERAKAVAGTILAGGPWDEAVIDAVNHRTVMRAEYVPDGRAWTGVTDGSGAVAWRQVQEVAP